MTKRFRQRSTGLFLTAATMMTIAASAHAQTVGTVDGANYPTTLQSLNTYGPHLNDLVSEIADCDRLLVDDIAGCAGNLRILAGGDFRASKLDGDALAAGYDSDHGVGLAGLAFDIGNYSQIGVLAGYLKHQFDFDDLSNNELEGLQLAAFADFQQHSGLYARLLGTMSFLENESFRAGVPGVAVYDANQWTAGAHFGYRIDVSPVTQVVPYLHLDYSNVDQDAIDDGVYLIPDVGADLLAGTVGAELLFDIGSYAADLRVGYRMQSGDDFVTLRPTSCSLVPAVNCATNLTSLDDDQASVILGGGFGGRLGRLAIMGSYNGEFSGVRDHHAGRLTLKLPLGDRGEVMEAPVVVPPPPPAPPPPPTVTCPDGTVILASEQCPPPPPAPTPPPPPVEPERG